MGGDIKRSELRETKMLKKKILIVDDEPTVQHLLKNLLEKEGFELSVAANGREGLAVLREQHFDLIILDILMPVMDGFEFYKEVKLNPALEYIPILVLTIRKKMEDSFMALGADAFLGKPLDSARLLSEIRMILDENYHKQQQPKETKTDFNQSPTQDQNEGPVQHVLLKTDPKTPWQQQKGAEAVKLQRVNFKNILVAGTIDWVVEFMVNNLKGQGLNVTVVTKGDELIAKAVECKPDIILMEINMDGTSAEEIINTIKKDTMVHTQILLYSYFVTEESEKNSIVHTYYWDRFEHIPHEETLQSLPVYYFGAFHKGSFINKIKKFLVCP